jgi:phosphohistidine phosphatase
VKTLHLLRHAKSSWEHPELDDHERPLARRGERAARRIAEHVAQHGFSPDAVLCSTAVRARKTLAALLSRWDETPPVRLDDLLYGASAEDLLACVREEADAHSSLLLVGHNPGIQDLACDLIADADPDALAQLHRKVPTGSWIEVSFTADAWRDIAPRSGRLERFLRPRALG